MSEILTKERRGKIVGEISRRIDEAERAENTDGASLWRFVRGIVSDYEATVEAVERLAVLTRRDVTEIQTKLEEQREVLERATRCRLCDGRGEYHVPSASGEPGAVETRVCLLCDYNGRRIDLLHSFLVSVAGAKSKVEVPQDSLQVLDDIVARAVDLMGDPVYNLAETARGGGESED